MNAGDSLGDAVGDPNSYTIPEYKRYALPLTQVLNIDTSAVARR
jgi:hypothetical protein